MVAKMVVMEATKVVILAKVVAMEINVVVMVIKVEINTASENKYRDFQTKNCMPIEVSGVGQFFSSGS